MIENRNYQFETINQAGTNEMFHALQKVINQVGNVNIDGKVQRGEKEGSENDKGWNGC